MKTKYWSLLFWILLVGWVVGAALTMARVKGGFLTNYLSDLAFPPWFYIYIRGLWRNDMRPARLLIVGEWFGMSAERAFISILLVGIISEGMTFYWPHGAIAGTFDAFDIVAYAVGLIFCYVFDKKGTPT